MITHTAGCRGRKALCLTAFVYKSGVSPLSNLTIAAHGDITESMSYCIMRMEKLKSRVALLRSAQHNTRERMPPNADERLSKQNFSSASVADVMQLYEQLLPDKVRKNAVHAVEVVITSSPDFNDKFYLRDADKWVSDLFGKENVLHVAHHADETTLHSHVLVMPLHEGKLNAKHFIGGSRDRMTELQQQFFEQVGNMYGLDRGKPRQQTRARHTPHTLEVKAAELEAYENSLKTLKQKFQSYDFALNTSLKNYRLPEVQTLAGMPLESAKKYRERIEPFVMGTVKHALDTVNQAAAKSKDLDSEIAKYHTANVALEKRIDRLDGKYGEHKQAESYFAAKIAHEARKREQAQKTRIISPSREIER